MATTIITKFGSGAPAASDVVRGELAVDTENKRLYTEDSGGSVVELGTNPAANITFGDNVKAIFGAGSDLQIYHTGTYSLIADTSGTGPLRVVTNTFQLNNAADTQNMINAAEGGAVTLYNAGNAKLATTSTGIDVTGTVTSDGLTVDTDTLVVDAANNRVGIGTTSPSVALEVSGQIKNNNGYLIDNGTNAGFLTVDGSNVNFGSSTAAKGLAFFTAASSQAMTINSSGNVGIGTSSPDTKLHLSDAGTPELRLESTDASVVSGQSLGDITWESNDVSGGGQGVRAKIHAEAENAGTIYGLVFSTGAGAAPTEKVRITNTGNVGIGTDSPSVKLHVVGSAVSGATFNGDDGLTIEQAGGGGSNINLIASNNTGILFSDAAARAVGLITYEHSSNSMQFKTNSSEAMRIDSSGNLLVGTTSANALITADNTANTANTLLSLKDSGGTGTHTQISFNNTNGQVGTINTSGTATAYNTSSDQRLKDNIVDAPSASDDIDAIQVRSFDWKADGSHQKYGMIAQELVTVAPEAVSQPEDPDEMMGVDYSKLVPMLIKEIQQLRARVAQLEGAN